MYFEDLSAYSYLGNTVDPQLLNVGWLDAEHDFPKGDVPEYLLARLLELCFKPVNQTRGYHQSPFIRSSTLGYRVEYQGKSMLLGSAEIRVKGANGRTYAAPNLIYHYIKDCGYRPPQEFLDAVGQELNE